MRKAAIILIVVLLAVPIMFLVGCMESQETKNKKLFVAAGAGNLQEVQNLIDGGADINWSYRGLTPLMDAITNNHNDVAQLLIAKGANVNARDNNGNTPLQWAVMKGNIEIAGALIAKGADVNARDNKGYTPLFSAEAIGQAAMAEFLRQHGGVK